MKTLRVRNFLRLKKVDIALNGIVLVAGRNSNGKSSLFDAAICAFSQSTKARGITTKKDAGLLVHDGADAGSISLEDSDGSAFRINYPAADAVTEGAPGEAYSALALGGEKFMDVPQGRRSAVMAEMFVMDPSEQDFQDYWKDRPAANLAPEVVARLWERIQRDGWDVSHTAAREHGLKLQGKWQEATGERYGTKKAVGWMPEGLMVGESYDVPALETELADAKREQETLLRAAGMTAGKRLALKEKADAGAAARKEKAAKEAEHQGLVSQLDEKLGEQRNLPAVGDTPGNVSCPHCGKLVRFTDHLQPTGAVYTSLERAPPPPSPDMLEATRKRTKDLYDEINAIRLAIKTNEARRQALHIIVQASENAAGELTKTKSLPDVDEDAVTAGRTRALTAERRLGAVNKLLRATAVHKQLVAHEWITDCYAPAGCRSVVMQRKMEAINARLSEISTSAGFEPVQLNEEMSATLGGRSYLLNGESGRWRVDLVLAALFNMQMQAPLFLVDRLDVLEPQARPGVLRMISQKIQRPALVMMMAKDRENAPDLAKAGAGKTGWIEDGTLTLL